MPTATMTSRPNCSPACQPSAFRHRHQTWTARTSRATVDSRCFPQIRTGLTAITTGLAAG